MFHITTAPDRSASIPGRRAGSRSASDFLFDAFFGGALGGSAVALFFLILDAFEGRPLFTPSLIGTVLFTGASPSTVTAVRLDMVAYYSIVHFATFGALGALISWLCHWSAMVDRHPIVIAGIVFLVLTAAIGLADRLAMPGIISAIGTARVIDANALTGLAMGWFIKWSHTEA